MLLNIVLYSSKQKFSIEAKSFSRLNGFVDFNLVPVWFLLFRNSFAKFVKKNDLKTAFLHVAL